MAYNRGMYTQCPQCRTIFEIDEDALQASLGIVRCGHCAERFDALRTLSDTLPTEPDAALPEHAPDALAPTLTSAVSPEAMQAAAKPPRRWASAPALQTTAPSANDAATQPDEAWFDALSGDRAHALIADAAGIPPEAIQGDTAWQLTDVPVQARFAELDIIPVDADEPATESGVPEAIKPAAAEAELAESEPFTEAWGLDIPDVILVDQAAPEKPATSGEAALPPAHVARVDSTDEPGDAPLAAAKTDAPDPWLPDDSFRNDSVPLPDASAMPGDGISSAEGRDTPQDRAEPASAAEPVYVPPRRRRIRRSDWLWTSGCAVLALVLAAQIAWASRVALVRDPATQAQVLRLCARFECRLPPIRDTAKLELMSRDVRPDPDANGALAITATFRNDAPFRQPWPIVVVELTDLDNNVVAMRRFRPAEYMPDAVRRGAGIAAGTTVAVAFEVADPGKRAVSFHFGFD